MRLYKNVDICDLNSIFDNGILSLKESGNNNWDDRKRADNSCDVVYLFSPLTKENSFTQYGVALLEVDVPDNHVRQSEMSERDVNDGKYVEYIIDEVKPEYIKVSYIPELFKERIDLPQEVMNKITWCGIKANYYGEDDKENCPDGVLEQFAKTAEIMSTNAFNFFRGENEDRTMIDLYDIEYVF